MPHAHHVNEAKHKDGTINHLVAVQHALKACAAILDGTLVLASMDQSDVPGHPGRVRFTFEADAK